MKKMSGGGMVSALLVACGPALLVACGPGDEAKSQPDSGGGSSTGGGTGDPSEAAGSGGSSSAAPVVAEAEPSVGTIQVIRTLAAAWNYRETHVTANFSRMPSSESPLPSPLPELPACETIESGGCRVVLCESSGSDGSPTDGGSDEVVDYDAGTITVTSLDLELSAVAEPDEEDRSYSFVVEGDLLGGDQLTVTASGGTVEAFTVNGEAPLTPLLLTPEPPVGGQGDTVDLMIDPTSDFTFTWDSRGYEGEMQMMVKSPSGVSAPRFSCELELEAGTATLAGELLQHLPSGTALHFFAVESAEVETPQGTVELLMAFELYSNSRTVYPRFVVE